MERSASKYRTERTLLRIFWWLVWPLLVVWWLAHSILILLACSRFESLLTETAAAGWIFDYRFFIIELHFCTFRFICIFAHTIVFKLDWVGRRAWTVVHRATTLESFTLLSALQMAHRAFPVVTGHGLRSFFLIMLSALMLVPLVR